MRTLGERVVAAALADRARCSLQLGVTEAEARLIRIEPGYARASTASRLDAFLLPDSLHFAEYNAESPAGPAYTQRLCELFDALPAMTALRGATSPSVHRTIEPMLDGAARQLPRLGRHGDRRRRSRSWTGASVPTWTEFELLRDAFAAAGVPTVVCDPAELTFESGALRGEGGGSISSIAACCINDIVARPDDCAALVDAYERRAVCVANTFRCKLPHKKAFFAVLTDDRERALFSEPPSARSCRRTCRGRGLSPTSTRTRTARRRRCCGSRDATAIGSC